jgi:hypothetical protein
VSFPLKLEAMEQKILDFEKKFWIQNYYN